MNRMVLMVATAGLLAGVGCSEQMGSYSGPKHAALIAKESAKAGRMPAQYIEFPHEGRIYVVGSPAAMNNVLGGGELTQSITKIAAGPKRETVIIEADKNYIEDSLIEQFNKKYSKTLTK